MMGYKYLIIPNDITQYQLLKILKYLDGVLIPGGG